MTWGEGELGVLTDWEDFGSRAWWAEDRHCCPGVAMISAQGDHLLLLAEDQSAFPLKDSCCK
jgi:hypothetical protein